MVMEVTITLDAKQAKQIMDNIQPSGGTPTYMDQEKLILSRTFIFAKGVLKKIYQEHKDALEECQ